jgi:rSAM/selenodomain-associated transferase 1
MNIGANRTESLILFARPPVPGRVKTRLIPALGESGATHLYEAFLKDAARMAIAVRRDRPRAGLTAEWAEHGGIEALPLDSWLPGPFMHRAQSRGDLGARMAAALGRRIAYCGRAVLMGTDFPDLPPEIAAKSLESLEEMENSKPGSRCAVLGPARDGGYYLIGVNAVAAGMIPALDWGGDGVFDAQKKILESLGFRVHILPEWRDVDSPEDLDALRERLTASPNSAPATRAALGDI